VSGRLGAMLEEDVASGTGWRWEGKGTAEKVGARTKVGCKPPGSVAELGGGVAPEE